VQHKATIAQHSAGVPRRIAGFRSIEISHTLKGICMTNFLASLMSGDDDSMT
jgi:hypothetical protein